MATRTHAIIAATWRRFANANDQDIHTLVTVRPNDEFSDITGQPDLRIPLINPNIRVCEIRVSNTTYAEITPLSGSVVLMSETYDDQTGDVISSNFESTPSAAQLTALANLLKSKFPGLDDEKLKRGGVAIFRAGLTRREILELLIGNFREL